MQLIHNAQLVLDGSPARGYVVIDQDKILEATVGEPDSDLPHRCSNSLDAKRAWLLPGVIDTHVHFREPGLTHKATIFSESRAAVAGGVTSYIDMPNVSPPTVGLDTLQDKWARAAQSSLANYSFYVGATSTNTDHLIHDIDYSRVPGVKVFLGSSTGGMLVDDDSVLHRLFARVPALVAVHSEDEGIIRHNLQLARERYGEMVPLRCHPLIRSQQACFESTRRAVALAQKLDTRLHLLHITTAQELDLLTAGDLFDKRITAEVCVGHLWFSDGDYDRLGTRIKVNPAIKTDSDRNALRHAIADDVIDVVSTDHAPHTLAEKQQQYLQAPSGMPLVQFSLVAMLELAYRGYYSIGQVVEKMCHAPARLFGVCGRGYLRAGYQADMVLVQPIAQGYEIADASVSSLCGWTPLAGAVMHHQVVGTWVNGVRVFPEEPAQSPAQPLTFNSSHR